MLLSVDGLTKKYKSQKAVDDLQLDIQHHQCVALLGPNGAGKTTTLQMLSGLLVPSAGSIKFMGKETINRKYIGYLPQYPAFFPWMTAREFLHFSGRLSDISAGDLKKRSEDMLHFVGLENARHKRIGGFSGGMKQRLGLAQALLHEPKLLILDEPVSALDPAGRRDVLKMMEVLKEKMTILFSTHVLHDAEQVCDEIVMMKEGKVKWSGPLLELKKRNVDKSFILTTEEKLEGWINKKEYIKDVIFLAPTTAMIKLTNESDRNKILNDCILEGRTIKSFEEKGHSLEDAYMEVMNQ